MTRQARQAEADGNDRSSALYGGFGFESTGNADLIAQDFVAGIAGLVPHPRYADKYLSAVDALHELYAVLGAEHKDLA